MNPHENSFLISDHLWHRLEPYIPSSWIQEEMGQSGIYYDYINCTNGVLLLVDSLWNNPADPRSEQYKSTIMQFLPKTKTYREYCLEELETNNKTRIKKGQKPQDIEKALHELVDEIPQAQELNEIAIKLRSITKEDLGKRNKLEEMLRLMGTVLRLAHSPEREQRFLKKYALT